MTLPRSIVARWARAAALLAAALAVAMPQHAAAQAKKDSVVLGMVLEPAPGLDPTMAAAAAIGEVVHMSVLEGLTKINMDGKITPLLAESWSTDPDGKVYTFKLRKGVKFHDGEAGATEPARRLVNGAVAWIARTERSRHPVKLAAPPCTGAAP